MLPLDQLIRPLTADELKDSIYKLLAAAKLPVTTWHQGAVVRTIIAVVAAVMAGFTEVISVVIRSGFLDLAEGVWLTLLAKYVYGVDRPEATFATGSLDLENQGGGLYEFEIGDLVVKSSITGKTYYNVEAFTLNPGESKTVSIRAHEAGAASTAAPDEITQFVTSPPVDVVCTNADALIGRDATGDPELRELCRLSLGALSPNGPAAAYEYVAKTAKRADGSSAGVVRVQIPAPPGDGTLTVIVGSASGAVPGDVNDPATDLGLVNREIQRLAVSLGVTALVESAVEKPIHVTCTLWYRVDSNKTPDEIAQSAAVDITAFLAGVPIGGYVIPPAVQGKVYFNGILGTLKCVDPHIINAEITLPAGSVDLAYNEAAIAGTLNITAVAVE